jgi:hypothetical protein
MSVYDRLYNWVAGGLLTFVICLIIFLIMLTIIKIMIALKRSPHSEFGALLGTALLIFGGLGIVVGLGVMLFNLASVKQTKYPCDMYDVEQMTVDYNARIIEVNYIEKPYIIHYEGYGSEEWICFVRKPSEQDKYLRGD